jgi:hypothetical protein
MSVRRGQENQWSLRRFERAAMMWTWPANSHTGPRHVTIAAMIRPDTCQHPIMRSLSQRFLLQRRGRPHMRPIILVERNLRLWTELKEPILLVRNRCRP